MEKKYIIELPENTHWVQWILESTEDHHPYMDFRHVEDLTPYTEPDLEQVRKEAYDKGYDDAAEEKYNDGLADAWDAARTLWNTPNRKEIFGNTTFNTVLTTLTAQETIEKIRQYEQEKEMDGLRQNIQTIVDQCGYTLDEIAEVLQKMKES